MNSHGHQDLKNINFIEPPRKRLNSEDKAGIYVTVTFHLAVIIVLLVCGLKSAMTSESSYMLDFSRQEEEERLAEEASFKEEISRRLDELIYGDAANAPLHSPSEVRNIAVDASSTLRDDRNTDAEKLYADAERLQQDLRNGSRQAVEEDMRDETVDLGSTAERRRDETEAEYKGPSVVSYSLSGRKASRLSIPAYRCMGGGEVTVIITVDNAGNVTKARIYDDISSDDTCLREFALRAARLSRFSSSPTAPLNQKGEIVYRFIPQ